MKLALLDPSQLLVGFRDEPDTVPAYVPKANEIPVPDDCDLVARRAHWDLDKKTFHLVVDPTPEQEVELPTPLRAIALALVAIRDSKPLPPETLAWLADWEKSFDARAKV